jgi:hypothetical protein
MTNFKKSFTEVSKEIYIHTHVLIFTDLLSQTY